MTGVFLSANQLLLQATPGSALPKPAALAAPFIGELPKAIPQGELLLKGEQAGCSGLEPKTLTDKHFVP